MIATLLITLTITAYTLGEGGGTGLTFSGLPPTPGMCAAGPWLPIGALVIVAGTPCLVTDRGGCIVDPDDTDPGACPTTSHLDIFMADLDKALAFGRQQLPVTILNQRHRRTPE